jgi:predicted nuclease of predicted toxin-antitoxin system
VKVLLDECLPRQLRQLIPGHEVKTAKDMGWVGIKNGQLLRLAEDQQFNVFVTADQELKYQQNMVGRKLAIIILPFNRRKQMPAILPVLMTTLAKIQSGDYVELEG